MRRVFFMFLLLVIPFSNYAQSKFDFFLDADIVSSYVWRGSYLSGASVQPSMGMKVGELTVGAWGSVDITGSGFKEIDLMIDYSLGDFSFSLNDYWFSEESGFNYFDFSDSTIHALEASITYSLPFAPVYLSWNTFVAGDDKYIDKNEKTKRAFSTYVEAGYDFSIKKIDLNFLIGVSLWHSDVQYTFDYPYATEKFAVINVALGARREIEITQNFSLGVFGQFIVNPAKEDAFLVLGVNF